MFIQSGVCLNKYFITSYLFIEKVEKLWREQEIVCLQLTHLLSCRKRVGYASMPPTRCLANSMPSQLNAKIYSLTFKLLFTSGVGIEFAWRRVGGIELGHFPARRMRRLQCHTVD